jgi:hypothetical protein
VPSKINDGLSNAQRYRRRHPERVKWSVQGGLSEKNKQSNRDSRRRSTFGADAVDYYIEKLEEQQGKCAVCGKQFTRTASQDHDHSCCPTYPTCGECKRGLVCQSCNMGLFYVETPGWLAKAKEYLDKWKA